MRIGNPLGVIGNESGVIGNESEVIGKVGNTQFQYPLYKQKSHLAEILSLPPEHIFCRFENQRIRGNILPWNSQILYFKNMLN